MANTTKNHKKIHINKDGSGNNIFNEGSPMDNMQKTIELYKEIKKIEKNRKRNGLIDKILTK